MKLHQLSVFLENRPGQLRGPSEVLGREGIDILTMSLADTAQFGILRLVVADWERAKRALEAAGTVVNVIEVVPVEVEDRPGGLGKALAVIDQAGLGIEYMYAFAAARRSGKAVIVFRFDDPDRAVAALQAKGIRVPSRDELFGAQAAQR
jgi:hypothetical protein